MKKTRLRWLSLSLGVSLCLGAGAPGASLAAAQVEADARVDGNVNASMAAHTASGAPDAVRAQAREIFANIIGIESSIGKGKVPLVAKYLAERFKAGGFPAADIHILPLGETASLVVRYRGDGSGGKPT